MIPVLWGHRGMGATDSDFVRAQGNHLIRPPEQSLASLFQVFGHGATAFEADAIRTADDRVVLMHSTRYGEHVVPSRHFADRPFLDQLSLAEIEAQLRIGADESEKVPELRDVLTRVLRKFSDISSPSSPVRLNLELKDVQGTDCPRRQPSLCALVLRDMAEVGFPLSAVRFSSFSLDVLSEMHQLQPQAALALLTDVGPEHQGDVGKRIFGQGSEERYRGFTEAAIDEALARLGSSLVAIHPEIRTVGNHEVAHVAELGLSLATWAWREISPLAQSLEGQLFAGAATRAFGLCKRHQVPLVLITDHLQDMVQHLSKIEAMPNLA